MLSDTHDPLREELVQILLPDGSCNEALRPIDDREAVAIYRQMLLLRTYDRKAVSLQRQGRFRTYAPMEGQEASLVASARALQQGDWLAGSYRETGAMWVHGV